MVYPIVSHRPEALGTAHLEPGGHPPDGQGRLRPHPGSQRQLARVMHQSAVHVGLGPPQPRQLLGKDALGFLFGALSLQFARVAPFRHFPAANGGQSCRAEILKAKSRKIQSAPASGGSTRRSSNSHVINQLFTCLSQKDGSLRA